MPETNFGTNMKDLEKHSEIFSSLFTYITRLSRCYTTHKTNISKLSRIAPTAEITTAKHQNLLLKL